MSELYLTQWHLNPRQRTVQQALADSQALHRLVMSAFPQANGEAARQVFGVLYRLEIDDKTGVPTLLLQSAARPDWLPLNPLLLRPPAEEPKNVSPFFEAIASGNLFRFRLRANPTRRVHTNHADDKLVGKRVNLRTDEQRLDWIKDKLRNEAGSELNLHSCMIREGLTQHGRHGKGRLSHGAVTFDGLLRVQDADALRTSIRAGIGPGKAYGFGLLSLAAAER